MTDWTDYHGDGTTIPLRYRLQAIQHFLARIEAEKQRADEAEAALAKTKGQRDAAKIAFANLRIGYVQLEAKIAVAEQRTEDSIGNELKLAAKLGDADALVERLGTALTTLVDHAETYMDGQSVKKGQRIGMALTYATAVLRNDPDPMKAVEAHWSDDSGLVTHFAVARQPEEGS